MGKPPLVILRPDITSTQKVRPPRGQRIASVSENGTKLAVSESADGLVDLKLTAGKEYRIAFR